MAMLALLKRMNGGERPNWVDDVGKQPIVVHGFRATFRAWAEEFSQFPHTAIEEAMEHAVGGAVERVYRRTDALGKRPALMQAWANCYGPSNKDKVVPLKQSGGGPAC